MPPQPLLSVNRTFMKITGNITIPKNTKIIMNGVQVTTDTKIGFNLQSIEIVYE